MTVTAAPPAESLAALFRRRRVENGVTLERVARDAELAYSTVVRIENGQRIPRRGTARAIAGALGITDAELEQAGGPAA